MWKPKDNKERIIATIVVWVGCSVIYGLFGQQESLAGVFGLIAIGVSIYVWVVKAPGYDPAKDLEKKAEKNLARVEKIKEKQIAKEKAKEEKGDILAFATLQYYGGGTISKEKPVSVQVTTTGLFYEREFIPIENITAVNLETQSQISSRVTLTRIALFGIFSLAAPKKKKSTEKYLTIDYDNGFVSTLVLGGKPTTRIQAALIKSKQASK